jgi:hypothetical protein
VQDGSTGEIHPRDFYAQEIIDRRGAEMKTQRNAEKAVVCLDNEGFLSDPLELIFGDK